MTNKIYNGARQRFALGTLNWTTASLRLLAMRGTLDFLETDTQVSTITARGLLAVIKESDPLNTQTVDTAGYLISNAAIIPAVPMPFPISCFVMILRGADIPTSIPLLFIDTAQGLPYTTDGLDVTVQPDWMSRQAWGRV